MFLESGVVHTSSQIRVGQIFRVPYPGFQDESGLVRYQDLTRGAHDKPADSQKGMFFYRQVNEPGQKFSRLPAFIFLSNPLPREPTRGARSDQMKAPISSLLPAKPAAATDPIRAGARAVPKVISFAAVVLTVPSHATKESCARLGKNRLQTAK